MKKEIIVCDECGNPIPGETGKIYDGVTRGYAGNLTVMLNTTEPYEDYTHHFCCRDHFGSLAVSKVYGWAIWSDCGYSGTLDAARKD